MRRTDATLDALVFDFDGVLFDSRSLMRHALETSFREHLGAGEPPFEPFFRLMGKPLDEILQRLGLPSAMAETYRRVSRECLAMAAPYEGALEALRATTASGL